MKKTIAFIVCLTTIFTLLACDSNTPEPDRSPAATQTAAPTSPAVTTATPDTSAAPFQAPKDYYAIVQLTINPKVNLYLDANQVVLAVEYVNQDAKTAYQQVEAELVGKNLENGLKTLVSTAITAGYLEKENKVTVDVVESKYNESNLPLLTVMGSTVKQTLQENQVEATLDVLNMGTQLQGDVYDRVTVLDAQNPLKSLQYGTCYIAERESEMENCIFLVLLSIKDDGYAFSFGDYSTDSLYETDMTLDYKGQTYYQCSGGGSGGECAISELEIHLIDDDVVLVLNEQSQLVVKSAKAEDSIFIPGAVFAIS